MPNQRSRILSAATCCLILLALCDGVRVDASFTSSIYENQVWNDATNSGIFGNAGNYTVSPQYTSGSYELSSKSRTKCFNRCRKSDRMEWFSTQSNASI